MMHSNSWATVSLGAALVVCAFGCDQSAKPASRSSDGTDLGRARKQAARPSPRADPEPGTDQRRDEGSRTTEDDEPKERIEIEVLGPEAAARPREGTLSIVETPERAEDAGATRGSVRQPVAGTQEEAAGTGQREPADPRPRPVGGALDCYREAERYPQLSPREALELCNGASGLGPVLCVEAALDRVTLEPYRALELCRCADSAAPVQCYDAARDDTTLSELERVQLCSPSVQQGLGMACVPATPTYP